MKSIYLLLILINFSNASFASANFRSLLCVLLAVSLHVVTVSRNG